MLKEFLKKYLLSFTILALATTAVVTEINAQSSKVTARVKSVKGRAIYSYKKVKNRSLKKGRSLRKGYEVRTRRNSRVVVNFSDGSQIVILSNTRIVFGDFEKATSLRQLIKISLGKVRIKINKFKNKPNPYRVRTPTASIAVRGTEFEVTVLANGETRVVTTEGLVEVYSLKKPDESLFSEPGRGVIVRANFTLDFLNPNLSGSNSENKSQTPNTESENKPQTPNTEVGNQSSSIVSSNSQPATNVYERFSGNLVQSVENFAPSRFIAVSNPHFDSLDNPAYAGAFDYAEGQIYFQSAISSERIETGDNSVSNNLESFVPLDYSVGLQGTFFTPIPNTRFIAGASGSFVRNGLEPLDIRLGSNSNNFPGSTINQYYNGSLVIARNFGDQDQTTVGVSYDRLSSAGILAVSLNQNNPNNTIVFGLSAFLVDRNRFTLGVKHIFDKTEVAGFYRYGRNKILLGDSKSVLNTNTEDIYGIISKANSSEIGFRVRRTVTPRFFYGVEGSLLFEKSNDRVKTEMNTTQVFSTQNTDTNRSSIGAGFGYLVRPQTIFGVDLNVGFVNGKSIRREDSTGDLLENNNRKLKFASIHAALQSNIWRGLFGSASINSFYRKNSLDQRIFTANPPLQQNPLGILTTDVLTQNSVNYTFSDFGLGWRFSPNYIVKYTFTTDYGKTTPRHNFLFRYSFDFGKD